jgi:hypothetical protein
LSNCEKHLEIERAGAGAAVRAGKIGLYSAEALADQKRVRELLSQSRELLNGAWGSSAVLSHGAGLPLMPPSIRITTRLDGKFIEVAVMSCFRGGRPAQ